MNSIITKLCIVIITICIPQFNCFYTERFFRERMQACDTEIQQSKTFHEGQNNQNYQNPVKTFYLESDRHSRSVLAGKIYIFS